MAEVTPNEIGGFEVLANLGRGARSTIYAVKDADDHIYALKHVVKKSPDDQRFLDQAIREHEVAQNFDHPSLRKSIRLLKQKKLLRTQEIMTMMEFVDAHTLETHQCETMLEFCDVIRQVAEGLGVMHAAGYVHADIKPNNILVTETDGVKIIDFGQSCETGTVKERIQGTPDYIAPEQVRREPITPATDVFNLGATMYYVLTGKHIPTLIPKGQPGQIVSSHGHAGRFQAPDEVDPNIPSALSKLVMESVEPDPTNRPKSMKAVADRLTMASVQLERRDNIRMRGAG